MKKAIAVAIAYTLLLALLPACDVLDAMKITPPPSTAAEPTLSPAPIPTPEPTPEPTPVTTPLPDVHSLPGDAFIKFQDPAVEKLIRTLLSKPTGDVTVAEMRTITQFDYNPDVYSFANHDVQSLDDLRYCENLQYLYITNCRVTDLSPLAGMKFLQSIWIGGNPVTDASPVLALPSLLDFNALQTGITDISALSGTKSLRTFYCDSKLTDYTPLLVHKNLWQVLLSGIDDNFFKALLDNCKGLSSIRIQNSVITSKSLALLHGRNLFALDMDNCGLKNISALVGIAGVKDLRLTGNYIEDISPLQKIVIGSYLDLRDNSIRNWSPLKDMKGLTDLFVSGNPVTQSDVLDKLEQGGCNIYR